MNNVKNLAVPFFLIIEQKYRKREKRNEQTNSTRSFHLVHRPFFLDISDDFQLVFEHDRRLHSQLDQQEKNHNDLEQLHIYHPMINVIFFPHEYFLPSNFCTQGLITTPSLPIQ